MAIPPQQIPANRLLQVLSREMAEMANISERLQTILLSACASAGNQRFVRDAQDCDLLTQKLANLSEFLEQVASVSPQGWSLDVQDACSRVTLSDLSDRLRLCPWSERPQLGELDLF